MADELPPDKPTSAKALRERAEELLRTIPDDTPTLRTEDVQVLVHELHVHQMELELQNEELRQAQLELSNARDRYADLYEFAPVGYVTMDKYGRIFEAKLTAATLFGVDRQDLATANISRFVTPDAQDDSYLHRQAVFSSGEKQACELAMHREDGTRLTVHLESIAFGQDGERRCRTALVDVTEKKLAADTLRELNIHLSEDLDDRTTQLQESVKQLKLLMLAISNLGEGVMITSDELDWPGPQILFVNEALCRITGYTVEELIGQTPRVLQGEQTDRTELDRLKSELIEGRSCLVELNNYRKDGTPYHAELFVTPLYDANGKRTNFVSIHRDVSERKRGERALSESEERFRLFMDNSPTVAWMKDEHGRYVYLNRTHQQHFKIQLEDWHGKTDFDLWPRESAEAFVANDHRVLDEERILEAIEHSPNPDGSTTEWHVFKFPFEDRNGVRYVGGIAADITERNRQQRSIRDREERLSAILNTASDAIITIDKQGIINQVNPTIEEMFGYAHEELLGQNVKLLMPRPYRDEHDEYLARYLQTGEAKIIGAGRELAGRRKDGTTFAIELSVSEVDHLGLFTGIIRDITERKSEQERLLQAERLAGLGEAMAGLTHESRNALARIIGNLRRLDRRLEGQDELLAIVDGVRRAAHDIQRQFEEVREYAAPLHLKRELQVVPDLVRRVWENLEPEWTDRDVSLQLDGTDLDVTCEVDGFLLDHAFRNILENALAACEDPVSIDIGFSEVVIEDAPAVRISIRDNGPGFPPDVKERAFEAFFTTKTRGTGLGLAIVKRSIEANGGTIDLNSKPGDGAEFIITLPRSTP